MNSIKKSDNQTIDWGGPKICSAPAIIPQAVLLQEREDTKDDYVDDRLRGDFFKAIGNIVENISLFEAGNFQAGNGL